MPENIIILECKCGNRWMEKIELPMLIKPAIARMKAMDMCPQCGSKGAYMLIGEKYQQAFKELSEMKACG